MTRALLRVCRELIAADAAWREMKRARREERKQSAWINEADTIAPWTRGGRIREESSRQN